MNLLSYFIWINMATQVSVICLNIIYEEYYKTRKRKNNIRNDTSQELVGWNHSLKTPSFQKLKSAAMTIIEGPPEQIQNIPLKELLKALKALKNTDIIPDSHIRKVWEMVKMNKSLVELDLNDLKSIGENLYKIPSSDLYYLNMTNWEIVEYLGKIKRFDTHQVAVLAAGLIRTHGFQILKNHTYINHMYEILCGFNNVVLNDIPDEEFLQIHSEIFGHLHACSMSRLRNLLAKATKPTIFGPLQVWRAEIVKKANMLILAVTPKELASVRPSAMNMMAGSVIELMNIDLIKAFSKKQIAQLNPVAYSLYKQRTYISSKEMYYKPNPKCNVIMLVSVLVFYHQ